MDITLNEVQSIIDDNKGAGFFAQQLESAFTALLPKVKPQKDGRVDPFSKQDLLDQDQEFKEKMVTRYQRVTRDLIRNLEKQNKILAEDGIITSMFGGMSRAARPMVADNTGDDPKNSTEKITEATKITWPEGEKLLSKFAKKEDGTNAVTKKNESRNPSRDPITGGGFLKTMAKILGATALLGIGGFALLKGFQTEGGLKGVLKLIGKGIVLKATKMINGLVTLIPGLSNVVEKGFKESIDTLLKTLSKDIFQNIFKPKALIKSGANLIKLLPKLLASSVGKVALKGIPVIGGLISFGFAYSRFKSGDIGGGLIEMVSGILNLFPTGITQVLSTGLDIFLAIRDLKGGESSNLLGTGNVNVKGMLEKAKMFLLNTPVIKYFTNIGKAFGLIFTGKTSEEFSEGIGMLISSSPIFKAFGFIKYLVDNKEEIGENITKVATNTGGVIKRIWSIIQNNIFNPLGEAVGDFLFNTYSKIKESFLVSKLTEMKNKLKNARDSFFRKVSTFAVKMGSSILGFVSDWMKNAIPFMGDKLAKQLDPVRNRIDKTLVDRKYVDSKLSVLATKDRPALESFRRKLEDKAFDGKNDEREQEILLKLTEMIQEMKDGNELNAQGFAMVSQSTQASGQSVAQSVQQSGQKPVQVTSTLELERIHGFRNHVRDSIYPDRLDMVGAH